MILQGAARFAAKIWPVLGWVDYAPSPPPLTFTINWEEKGAIFYGRNSGHSLKITERGIQ